MARIISVHEYVLRSDADPAMFEKAVREADDEGLLQLPGLENHLLLKGIRGKRKNRYAAVWIYESREKWEKLWGPLDMPWDRARYPENWKKWENDILEPFLDRDPDRVRLTSYEEL
jgi:hypothetical protein